MAKFLRLPLHDQWLLVSTMMMLLLVRLGLAVFGFRRLWRLLERMQPDAAKAETAITDRVVWAVNIASRWSPGGATCLPRALTTQTMMALHGQTSTLRIGVAFGERGTLDAHAWVENQSGIIIGHLRDLSRYTPLPLHQVEGL